MNRRCSLHLVAVERQNVIRENYIPLHRHVYNLQVDIRLYYPMSWIIVPSMLKSAECNQDLN